MDNGKEGGEGEERGGRKVGGTEGEVEGRGREGRRESGREEGGIMFTRLETH